MPCDRAANEPESSPVAGEQATSACMAAPTELPDSFFHSKAHLIELVNVIDSYRWVCDVAPVDFLYRLGKGQATRMFSEQELAAFLPERHGATAQLTDLMDIPAERLPLSLFEFVAVLRRALAHEQTLAAQARQTLHRLPKATSSHLFLGMKPKKQYEVMMMARLVSSVLDLCPQAKNVVEMGSGHGYLSSFLAVQLCQESAAAANETGLRYLGLDYNANNVRCARERHERVLSARQYGLCRNVPVHFFACHIAYPAAAEYSKCLDECLDWSHGRKALMLGLHGCGDLSSSMLRIFRDDPRYQALVQVGCCYHLLGESCAETDSGCGFPQSRMLKERGFSLGRYLRNLACSSPERDISVAFDQRLGPLLKLHFYSALFHVILVSEGLVVVDDSRALDEKNSLPSLGNLRSLQYSSFAQFCQHLCLRLGLDVISESTLCRYEAAYRKYYASMSLMLMLQRWMGALVEQCILLDRVLACREFGFHAELVPLFDRVKSPRSHVLLVYK